MPDAKTCPECGAVLPEGAEQCGLCGASVQERASAQPESAQPAPNPSEVRADAETGVFCNECGWKNPPRANFCSRCGQTLQADAASEAASRTAKAASGPPGAPPAADIGPKEQEPVPFPSAADDGLGRRVAVVVGVAVLLVAGLFAWSAWSGSEDAEAPAATADGAPPAMSGGAAGSGAPAGGAPSGEVPAVIRQQQGGDVPAGIAARADSLQRVIETQGGRRRRLARRELGSLFAGAGLTSRAAAQQWQLAQEAGGDPAAWERAGSLLYDWMASLERSQERAQVARLTVDAYERVLQGDPDNQDVRTNLAVAYLDTNNPMRGISEIKRVLREAPDHVGARFNYGLMQMMIGRNASAIEQFERVRATAGEDSPYYEQAGAVIERINEQTDGTPQDTPTPGGSAPTAGAPGSS